MVDIACNSIMKCQEAAKIIRTTEEALYICSQKLQYHLLPAIEQCVRTIAQDENTISGVFYALVLKAKGKFC